MDLETPDPIPPASPASAAPAEPPAPVAPDPDEAVEVGGQKMVPLAALTASRDVVKSLKDKAAKGEELERYVNEVRPYVEFLAKNPQLLQPQQAPQPAAPNADPELVELARSLDYYKADGSPDLERAAKHDAIIQRRAARIAQQYVQPVAQANARQQSVAVWNQFATQKLPNGQTIDPQILGKYWRALPESYTADPRIAATVFSLAGMEQMQNATLPPAPPAPSAAPLVTESVGQGPRTVKPITPIERAVVAARGITDTQYADLTKGFTPGRTSSLED